MFPKYDKLGLGNTFEYWYFPTNCLSLWILWANLKFYIVSKVIDRNTTFLLILVTPFECPIYSSESGQHGQNLLLYMSEYSTASFIKLIISFNKPIHNLMHYSNFGCHGNQMLKNGTKSRTLGLKDSNFS